MIKTAIIYLTRDPIAREAELLRKDIDALASMITGKSNS